MKDEEINGIIDGRLKETLGKTKKDKREIANAIKRVDVAGKDLASLAKAGLSALIDEVTGYQDKRGSDALITQLETDKDKR